MHVTKTHQKQTPTNEQHPRRPAARPRPPASFKQSVCALAMEVRAGAAGVLRRAGRRWRRTWTGRSWFSSTTTKTTKMLREVKMTVGGWRWR